MSFFNLPDFFSSFGDNIRQGYEARYERKLVKDYRNSALLAPLETSLNNLVDIRDRAHERIQIEMASGTDMTGALSTLEIADSLLEKARIDVGIATSTVTAAKPRPAYRESQQAYISMTIARSSLDALIDSIDTAVQTSSSTSKRITPHAKNTK